ncbi:MAG: OmpA family protein, partial [Treponema sp.]|nr:OmpA family protein [Treponema sp.]
MDINKICILFLFATLPLPSLPAQEGLASGSMGGAETPAPVRTDSAGVTLYAGGGGPYNLMERSDWSRYDNGKYIGHVYREVRASIAPERKEGAQFLYRGNFIVLEETLRDMRESARGVNAVAPVRFTVEPNGKLSIEDDQGFPNLRGFPAFPLEAVKPGAKWSARGTRAADPLNNGNVVLVPLAAEYEYRGVEDYKPTGSSAGIPVHRISAKYASRYGSGRTAGSSESRPVLPEGDFSSLQGTHTVDILIRASDGLPLLTRDNLDETFTWPNGATVRFRGFTLTFGQGTVPLNKEAVIKENMSPAKSLPNVDFAPVPEGVKLTVRDLKFAPDSDEFLPTERSRLDALAAALKRIPDRLFLVEGHTASVGRSEGEQELSLGRAKRMVDELASRGISADRFVYKGWGGGKPLGDN